MPSALRVPVSAGRGRARRAAASGARRRGRRADRRGRAAAAPPASRRRRSASGPGRRALRRSRSVAWPSSGPCGHSTARRPAALDGWLGRDYARRMTRHLVAATRGNPRRSASPPACCWRSRRRRRRSRYFVGNRLGLPVNPAPDGTFEPASPNVKVFGAIYSAESCSYDAERGLIVVPNRGVPQNVQTNNAWVSLHQPRRLGAHRAVDRRAEPGRPRATLTPPLVLNEPLRQRHRQRHALRRRSRRRHDAERSERRRHPQVRHEDGRAGGRDPRRQGRSGSTTSKSPTTAPSTPRRPASAARRPIRRRGRSGRSRRTARASIFVQGAPLRQPNGVALDGQGNIVVVNIGNDDVLTFSPDGTAAEDREGGAGRQRRPRDHARRHEVRQQRAERRRLAHSPGPAGRADRARTSRARRRCATTPAPTSW